MLQYSYITSKDNKNLKLVDKLQNSAKFRYETNLFVLEGERICQDAIDNNITAQYTFVSESIFKKSPDTVQRFFDNSQYRYVVNDELFSKVCDTVSPQGIIIVATKPNLNANIDKNLKYIALDGIQDTANLGAIARTSEAFGLGGIILNDTCCDPYSPKSLRASMGTILRIPLFFTDDLISFIMSNDLNAISYVIDDSATEIDNIQYLPGDVIVIGNEANGVSKKVIDGSRILATIPMSGGVQSLNAASAAAIAIYNYTKKA